MDYDGFLDKIGQFGRFQKKHYFVLSLSGVLSAFTTMGYVFMAAVPDHWCATPAQFSNLTLEQRKALTLPFGDDGKHSRCSIYDFSSLNISDSFIYELVGNEQNVSLLFNTSGLPVVQCSTWEYDTSIYSNTAVTKWDLICGKEWIAATMAAANGIGKLTFGIIAGILSDRFGRKKILVLMTIVKCIVGVLSAFSPNPYILIVATGIMTGTSLGAYMCAFLLGMEMVGVKYRELAGILIYVAWSVGYMALAVIAYFLRDWVLRQVVLHAQLAIFALVYACYTPESSRWLLSMGREDEALEIMKTMTETNGKEWDENITIANTVKKANNVTIMALVKSKRMVLLTLACCFMWFTCNLLFYGLSYNSSNLAGNPYWNFGISGAVEIPALGCAYALMNSRFGRRGALLSSMLLATLALLGTVPVPADLRVIATVLAMLGKFGATVAFAVVFIYMSEIYPTSVRTMGGGLCSVFGRLGSIATPYIAILGTMGFETLPLLLFGIVSLLAACVTLFLPETKSVPLPETLEDVHKLQNSIFPCKRCDKGSPIPEKEDERDVMVLNEQPLDKEV